MAANSLQPAATMLSPIRRVPSPERAHRWSLAPQEVLSGNSDFVKDSSLPAIPGGPTKCEPAEVSCNQRRIRALQSRQECLWRQYFWDPSQWWDYRQHKKSTRFPDFRNKVSKEVLWLDNVWKPAWVDKELAALDSRLPSTSSSNLAIYPGGCEIDVDAAENVIKLCEKGQLSEAVDTLGVLVQTESRASTCLFYSVLKGCVARKNLVVGRRVHELIVKVGYDSNTFLATHLLRMYASHGRLQEVKDVFARVTKPDAFSWSSVIAAHAKHGEPEQAIKLYQRMRSSSVKADGHVFVAALQACAAAADLECGRQVHADVLESRVHPDLFVWNCLVDMYAKCGRLEDARMIFDGLGTKDVVTWTAMIGGYAQHGRGAEALSLHEQMKLEGVVVANPVTLACLLNACASVGALQHGKQFHAQIVERGLEVDSVVGTSLVDMYAKCGRLEDARRVLSSLPSRNVGTWNAMISGFGQSNDGHKAIQCFQEMILDGVEPDEITYTCLLVACGHEGLVEQGEQFFKAMTEERGITPTIEHCNCMVDLLGRAGYLDEAENMLSSYESSYVGSMSLLNGCRSHGDIERGFRCFERLRRLDPGNASAYVLMGNIYADAGRWSDVERIEMLRKSAGASKKPAVAGIEVDRHVHTFVVGDEGGDISSKVRSTISQLKDEGGHVPRTELVRKLLSEKDKEEALCGHAEKLALAYGLLNTPDGTPLLVTKNLRMCGDCHSSTEILSRIERRQIIVRDAHRVHQFVDGSCCCGGRP